MLERKWNFLFQVYVVIITITIGQIEARLVQTESGPIYGREEFTIYDNKSYIAFRGIPYAEPPIGNLRFRPPQRIQPWNQTMLTVNFGSNCLQQSGGNENCLFLNVYSPNITSGGNLPVVIGIHGGSFLTGSGNDFGPDLLFNQADMVMVTVNYRLGIMGFLTLNTTEYSGNMGLKDQLLAIRWVNENIHHFGGNSSRITLYGISAGSSSVHYQVLSPESRPYFQQAILASGVALNPWSQALVSAQIPTIIQIAQEAGTPVVTFDEILEFLLNSDGYNLTIAADVNGIELDRAGLDLLWAPVVEQIGSDDAFLTDTPSHIMATNLPTNITTMFGYNFAESYPFVDFQLREPELLSFLNERFRVQLPTYIQNRNFIVDDEQNVDIAQAIRQFYFGENDLQINASSLLEYTQLISDLAFNYAIDRTVNLHAAAAVSAEINQAKTFYYRFSAVALLNIFRWITVAPALGLPGATHGDDFFYAMANVNYLGREIYEQFSTYTVERRLINQLSQVYSTYIVYGDPGFSAVQNQSLYYLDFTNDELVESANPQLNTTRFWDNLFDEFDMWW